MIARTALRRHWLRAVVPFLLAVLPLTAFAEDWDYRVRPGDTLWDLSGEYLKPGISWKRLQDHNRIRDPYNLPPGSVLRFPLGWLYTQPVHASVVAVEGKAMVAARNAPSVMPVVEGMQLGVGAMLQTTSEASLSLRFADGSQMRLRGDSELVLDRMSQYGRTGMTDTRLRLQRGRLINEVSPQRGFGARFVVVTPTASSAVRGTRFRIDADASHTDAEVIEGKVAVDAGGPAALVAGGYGTVARAGQHSAPVAVPLLPAPDLSGLAPRYLRGSTELAWPAIDGARSYRVQASRRDDFATLVADATADSASVELPRLPAGEFHVQVRAIDDNGLEGMDAQARIVVDGDPEPPFAMSPIAGGTATQVHLPLGWTEAPQAHGYRYQVATDAKFRDVVASGDLAGTAATLAEALPAGDYFWRVASLDAAGEQGPYSDASGFTFRPLAPIDDIGTESSADSRAVTFRWPAGLEGQKYRFQLSRSASFKRPRVDELLEEPQITLPKLGVGTWYMRAQAVEADGTAGEFPAPQKIEVPCKPCQIAVGSGILLFLLTL